MSGTVCARTAILMSLTVACVASGESSLTVYNQNFAVVRESLPLDLKAGTNEVRVTEITAHMEPDSVILRDPQGKRVLRILEQNYRADPVSQGLLLSLYEGKEIDFLVRKAEGKDEIVRGRIVRSGYVPHQAAMQQYGEAYRMAQMSRAYGPAAQSVIVEVGGKLRFSLPGEPLFPSLADDTILEPTVHWVLETDIAGKLDAELSYVTGGMSWEADYSMLAQEKDDLIDVIGWVTMDNQSGRTFENARIKLMAGDVSKIQPEDAARYGYAGAPMSARGGPAGVSEKAFEEYHLYTLHRPTTLHDRETKQVEFLRAEGVQAQRLYIYDGLKVDQNRYRGYNDLRRERDYGTQSNPKVWVMKEFKNSEANRLGVPLPKGRVRFYRRDDDGRLEFTGENTIDHTPRDETVRVYTGDAFDLVGERRRTDFQTDRNSDRWVDESFEIKLRNRKEEGTVEVRVVEHLYRWVNWEIVEKSNTFLKTDSQTIEFRVQVPAGEEKVITYKVHYSW